MVGGVGIGKRVVKDLEGESSWMERWWEDRKLGVKKKGVNS